MPRSDARDLLRELRDLGIEVEVRPGGHVRAVCPLGPVFFPCSPSDRRSTLNTRATLRKFGVPLGRQDVKKSKRKA